MNEPTLKFKYAVYRLAIDPEPFAEAQQRPEPPITESRMEFNQPSNAFGQHFIEPRRCLLHDRARPQPGPGKLQDIT
jgi:hypothetical protein